MDPREESSGLTEVHVRQVVAAAPNAMVMVGCAGWIVLVNARTEKLFGYGRDEMFAKSIETLVPARVPLTFIRS
jgi:PAS domain S-box-containing protein